MRFTVRSALGAAFAAVVGLFAAAAAVTVVSIGRVQGLEDRLSLLDRAKHGGHLAVIAVQDLYIHQAHSLIAGDRSHLDHYEEARGNAASRVGALRDALLPLGLWEEAAGLAKSVAEMDRFFQAEVVPALPAAGAPRTRPGPPGGAHLALERLTQDARRETDRLNAELDRRSEAARAELGRVLGRTRTLTLGLLSLAAAAAALVGLALVRMIGRPLSRLQEAVGRLEAGNLDARVAPGGPRELTALARRFNEMAAALEEGRRLAARNERMAVMGEIAAGVAHELNNPLGVITGYLKVLRRGLPEGAAGTASADLSIVEEEVDLCRRIVAGLLDLARPPSFDLKPLDLGALAAETAGRMARAAGEPRPSIEVEQPPAPVVALGDEDAVRRVLGNLLDNAFDAAGASGRVRVRVERRGGEATLFVEDSGPGLPAEIARDIFKPFRTTKPKGTGLGLALCDQVARGHGGRIDPDRGDLGGARFRVVLPAAEGGLLNAAKDEAAEPK